MLEKKEIREQNDFTQKKCKTISQRWNPKGREARKRKEGKRTHGKRRSVVQRIRSMGRRHVILIESKPM